MGLLDFKALFRSWITPYLTEIKANAGSGGFPFPQITEIDFSPLFANETKDIIIKGSYFTSSTTVSITNGTDIILVNSVTFDNSGQLTVNITTLSVVGGFDVIVNNGNITTESNGITVVSQTILVPGDGTTLWTNEIGNITTSLAKIVRTSTSPSSWNSHSGCFGFIPSGSDGYMEFNPIHLSGQSNNAVGIFGLSTSPVNSYLSIDYSFNIQNSGSSAFYVRELTNSTGNLGSWAYTDVFRIERIGTTVYFKIDSGSGFNTVHTSSVSSSSDLYFSCDINKNMGADNLKIVY